MSTADIRKALLEAEIHISSPTIALTKLRYIGEALTTILAGRAGVDKEDQETQLNFLRRLEKSGAISKATADDLHQVRMLGNDAIHQNKGTIAQAGEALTLIRRLLKEHLGIAASETTIVKGAKSGLKAKIQEIAAGKGQKDQRRSLSEVALSNPLPTAFSVSWSLFVKWGPWALGAILLLWLLSTISSCVADFSRSASTSTKAAEVAADNAPPGANYAATEAASAPTVSEVYMEEQSDGYLRYLVRDTNVREQPTGDSRMINPIEFPLPRGDSIQGVVVPGIDPRFQWVKITTGPYAGYFIAMSNLSDNVRPTLDTSFSGSKRTYTAGLVFAEADRSSDVLQEVEPNLRITVVGLAADGLVEISMRDGTIAYVDRSVFSPVSNNSTVTRRKAGGAIASGRPQSRRQPRSPTPLITIDVSQADEVDYSAPARLLNRESISRPSDYPMRSERNRETGTVGYTVTVNTNGRVVGCQITRSSGYPDLDQQTCKLLQRRAKFQPAMSKDGAMVFGQYRGNWTWRLSE